MNKRNGGLITAVFNQCILCWTDSFNEQLGAKAKVLIPFSMIFGAILLLLADTLARVLIAPSELPAGVITSILGAPFFLSLCLKSKEN